MPLSLAIISCDFMAKKRVLVEVRTIIPDATEIIIAPTMKFHQWRIAAMNEEQFFVGKAT